MIICLINLILPQILWSRFCPLVDQKVARMQITEIEQGEKMIVDILNQEVVIDGKRSM